MNNFPFKSLTVFGHRGFPSKAVENTLASFELIKKYSIPAVELDLHLCASGEIVICHDFSTGRIFNEDCVINTTDYSKLKSLKVNDKFKRGGSPTGLPRLTEVFDLLGSDIIYDLEIKSKNIKNHELIKKVIALADEYNLIDQSIISSFNPFCVRTAGRMGYRNTALIYSNDRDVYFFLRRGQGKIISHPLLLKPNVKELSYRWNSACVKKNPERILTWTVNNPDEAEILYKKGIRGFISNDPKKILDRLAGLITGLPQKCRR